MIENILKYVIFMFSIILTATTMLQCTTIDDFSHENKQTSTSLLNIYVYLNGHFWTENNTVMQSSFYCEKNVKNIKNYIQ